MPIEDMGTTHVLWLILMCEITLIWTVNITETKAHHFKNDG